MSILEKSPNSIETEQVETSIQDAIMRLNRIAITIRQSSRSAVTTLARNYAIVHRDLEALEHTVSVALEALYPNAPESLREQLCNTMTDRYARLEYHVYRKDKYHPPKPWAEGSEGTATPSTSSMDMGENQTLAAVSAAGIPDTRDGIPKEWSTIEQSPYRKPLSSLDTAQLRQSLGADHFLTSRPSRTLSVYQTDDKLHEPEPPHFKDGAEETACQWCDRMIDRSLVKAEGWSDAGRSVISS